MLEEKVKNGLRQAFEDIDTDACIEQLQEALKDGVDPMELMRELIDIIQEVGDRFSNGEIFLPELIMSGDLMQEGVSILRSELDKANLDIPVAGTIVLGSVRSDVHDIGKDIVKSLFSASGFKVYDLGVDVPTETFIQSAEENHADIIALSATMSTTLPPMKEVMEHLEARGVRKKYKVLVGGGSVTPEFADLIGADGYGDDANEAVVAAKKVMQQK